MTIPRPEHPKPQFQRANWQSLNGPWGFEIDNTRSGLSRGFSAPDWTPSGTIIVPFCPESQLSGVAHKDFILGAWYQRSFHLTPAQCAQRTVLHFGAVDYSCQIFVNGTEIGSHQGGYVSFSLDITKAVHPGENIVTVSVQDDPRDPMIPTGKQSDRYASYDWYYTRTTGIWQSVWLEFTPHSYIRDVQYDTDVPSGTVVIRANLVGAGTFRAEVHYRGLLMGSSVTAAQGGEALLTIRLDEIHLWEPGHGRLYDVTLTFGEDQVASYFGLRSIGLNEQCFFINDSPVFQRLVLDQGFYPDGIYTAPTDEALARDIDLAMAMGFNGARLHEKIFEERYLYHCDRKGYLVWSEYPNWGLNHADPMAIYSILPEWLEEIQRDRNHPSIIGWCPFNETWDIDHKKQHDDLIRLVYRTTKALDPTRPCIDSSGNFHVETDIFDVHDYQQDPALFREHYDTLMQDGTLYDRLSAQPKYSQYKDRQIYRGEAVFLSEYGGIQWSMDESGWGYGQAPKNPDEFRSRLKGLTDALMDNGKMCGLCYTQLTDVEQEQNGLYTYDRKPKLEPAWVRSVFSRTAAIEQKETPDQNK